MNDDYLIGAAAIAKELQDMGVIRKDDPHAEGKARHLERSGQVKYGRLNRALATTTTKLHQQIAKITS
jgi:hypothetical protein